MIRADNNPVKRVVDPKLDKTEPFRQIKSIIPMISKLNTLLPNTLPAAKSAPSAPPINVTALTPVPNSGKDVAVASNTTPTKDLPSPVLKAIISAFFAR